jgi:DNA repair exonuclease SbcCD ATPase subunit
MTDTKALDDILQNEMVSVDPRWQKWYLDKAAAELAELKAEVDTCYTQNEAFRQCNAELRNQLHTLQAALDEWENAKKFVADGCKDEQHCGCVPILKRQLDEAREVIEELLNYLGHPPKDKYSYDSRWEDADKHARAYLASHPKAGAE